MTVHVSEIADRRIWIPACAGMTDRPRKRKASNRCHSRELTWEVQEEFNQETAWYVHADGSF